MLRNVWTGGGARRSGLAPSPSSKMADDGIAVEVGLLSRRYGPLQRRVCDVLLEYEGLAVETTDLKKLVSPEGDRSNLRRALRTAVRRGLLHEWSESGRRFHELSVVG